MKILIVGGTSSLSKSLIPELKKSAHVITAGRNFCDMPLDLKDLGSISLPEGLNVVIHTAAHFGGKTHQEVWDAEMINVMGTLRLCQASILARVDHFIYVSSMSATLTPESPYYSIYALAKRQAEEVSRQVSAMNGMPLTVLRPSQLYGDSDDFKKHQPLIYNIINQAQKGMDITLYGKNDALRNYLHIDDFVKTFEKVISQKVTGTYVCQYGKNNSISEVARAAIAAFNSKSRIVFQEDRDDIENNIFPSDDSLYRKIDFHPRIEIEEGLKRIAKIRMEQ